jgi:hypothetical protein
MAEMQFVGGARVTPGYEKIDPISGQQLNYVVLTDEERAKGFIRPVRMGYTHAGRNPTFVVGTTWNQLESLGEGGCGSYTRIVREIAETYARDIGFYTETFCAGCRKHRPLNQFYWDCTQEMVGS